MSPGKPVQYWASAAVLVIGILLTSGAYTGAFQVPGSADTQPLQGTRSVSTTQQPGQSTSATSTQHTLSSQPLVLGPNPSTLIVQLTDPPVVPTGTTSLNLTYSAINLVVAVPATTSGQVTPQAVAVTPQGGSATLDLFKLQNVSQTIASANLPNGTTIYSLSFTVTGVSIEINGTVSPVTLATGASALQVTLAKSSPLSGTNAVLVQLSPTVVDTPTGYQMIPSAVGILRVHSQVGSKNTDVGSKQPITTKDKDDLDHAKGKVTATLLALSVAGNSTTLTVRVNNTGDSPVKLVAVGLSGSFTPSGLSCTTSTTPPGASSTKSTTTSTSSNGITSTKTSTATTTTSTNSEHHTTTTTATSATNSTIKAGGAEPVDNSSTRTTFTTTMPPTTTYTSTVTTSSPTTTTTTSAHTFTTTYTHSNTTYTYTYTITSGTKTTATTTSTSGEHEHRSSTYTTTYTRSTTTHTYSTSKDSGKHDGQPPSTVYCKGIGGLVLVPLMAQTTTAATSSTSSSSSSSTVSTTAATTTSAKTCSAGKMAPVYGDQKTSDENDRNLLGAGQCVDLTFSGPITFTYGQYSITIIPSTAAGQTYVLGVLGSSEAVMVSCKLPVTSTSCTEVIHTDGK